jgi:hypothetical protein
MRFVHYIISIIVAVALASSLWAQVSPQVPPDQAAKLQVLQPTPDMTSPVTATATFDPPMARVGQSVYYRVALDGAGESIPWPGAISAPPELKFGPVSQGQLMQFFANKFRPLKSYLYPVRATAAGHFTVPAFVVMVDGKPVQIPAATLDVNQFVSGPPPRQLVLEISSTNVFLGQPFRARAMLPASPANQIEAAREVEFNGNAFMSDLTTMRQAVEMVRINGNTVPAYIYELTLTPIETGRSALSAQGFASGHEFFGPTTITARQVTIPGGPPSYVLLVSDPVQINVRPLPTSGQPADFNGSIGTFTLGAPQLSTNRVQVGQPIRLSVAVHSLSTLNRPVAPTPPTANDWEIIPDNPPDFSFTLIPLTDTARQTPAIPFSYFDPETGRYVDATIPSVPVTVTSEGLPTEMPADTGFTSGPVMKLSALSIAPGSSVASLVPLQLRGGVVCFQIVPILVILALWQWDRRRRFLEAHPDIVRRRKARRLLRRERRRLRNAARRGDEAAIIQHAANAMQIASAPHYPAHPQALVCSDILEQLDDTDRSGVAGETVRKVFAATDARFALTPQTRANWATLPSDVDTVLVKLEEQL